MLANFVKERGFQYGVAGSVIWHLFWLFAISVSFGTGADKAAQTRIHFIGPVLTDDAFNTLVAMKPELSETIYRAVDTLSEASLEPEIGALGYQSPGETIGVPTARTAWSILRGALGATPGGRSRLFEDKLPVNLVENPFPITGQLKSRDLFFVPRLPTLAVLNEEAVEALFEISVDAEGRVVRVENIESSGSPKADLAWQRHLKAWQFMPLDDKSAPEQTGRIQISHGGSGAL